MKLEKHRQNIGNADVNRRISAVVLLAATLILVGGGCVSYNGCHTQEDCVRARYEQYFILSDDSSSAAFWKNTKHVFLDFVTCCFHEIWRSNAKKTYWRMILEEQRQAHEEEAARQREAERQARLQLEQQRKAQALERKPPMTMGLNGLGRPHLKGTLWGSFFLDIATKMDLARKAEVNQLRPTNIRTFLVSAGCRTGA